MIYVIFFQKILIRRHAEGSLMKEIEWQPLAFPGPKITLSLTDEMEYLRNGKCIDVIFHSQ